MKKKIAVLLGAGSLAMAALCGCGATTESIVDKMFDQDAESFTMTMDMDIDVSAGMSGLSIPLQLSGTMEAEVDNSDEDAPASHVSLDVKASAMGSSQKVKTESYLITEDDQITSYVKDPDSGDWSYTSAEVKENPLDKKSREKIIDEVKEVLKTAELQKKTEKKEGEDCYVLTLSTTFDAFDGIIDVFWDSMDAEVTDAAAEAGVDKKAIVKYLEYFNVDATIYASKKNGYMVAMDMDFAESDTDGLLKQVNKDFGDLFSTLGVDFSTIKVDLSTLSFSTVFGDWGDSEVSIPKDVKNNATNIGDLGNILDGDGMINGGDDDDDDWNTVDGDGYDNDDDDDDDDDDDTDPDTSSSSSLKTNADGSVPLYDYYDNYVADVKAMKGYEIQSDWSSNTYLMYGDDDWSYYSVGTSAWSNWGDVEQKGESSSDGDVDLFMYEDSDYTYVLADLGILYDGKPVYAAAKGTYNEKEKTFDDAQYYIVFEYNAGWCEVYLDSQKAENWEWSDFEDAFDQIFE